MTLRSAPDSEWRDVAFGPKGRLALSHLRVERKPHGEPGDFEDPLRPGLAHAGVAVYEPPNEQPVLVREWTVEYWNHESPQIAFDRSGRLYAIVWPSAYEIELP